MLFTEVEMHMRLNFRKQGLKSIKLLYLFKKTAKSIEENRNAKRKLKRQGQKH